MKPDFRKCMIWLHTYVGLILGWLLFAIFVTGTLSYFTAEISHWMKPEQQFMQTNDSLINRSLDQLHTYGKEAERWRIYLPSERNAEWRIRWTLEDKRYQRRLNENAESIEVRETKGGLFFRNFHYTLQLRPYGGRYIAGIAAMGMLIAIFSGIYTHRRFFKDFFTVRTKKLTRFLADFHAIAGIITIPFCIMVCLSGIMIYAIMYNPSGALYHFENGEKGANRVIFPRLKPLDKNGVDAQPIHSFDTVQNYLSKSWDGDNQIARITFEQPYKQNGRIIVDRVKSNSLSNQAERLVFSSHTGMPIEGYREDSATLSVRRVFFGLHEAKFASIGLRWMLFILGALSCALIATGLIIWLRERVKRLKQPHWGYALVTRLNVVSIAGLFIAIFSYFIANRLLPLQLENRADAEISVFLWVWLLALIHGLSRKQTKLWQEQFLCASILAVSVSVIDILTEPQRVLMALTSFDSTYLTFHFCILTSAGILFFTFHKLGGLSKKQSKRYHFRSQV